MNGRYSGHCMQGTRSTCRVVSIALAGNVLEAFWARNAGPTACVHCLESLSGGFCTGAALVGLHDAQPSSRRGMTPLSPLQSRLSAICGSAQSWLCHCVSNTVSAIGKALEGYGFCLHVANRFECDQTVSGRLEIRNAFGVIPSEGGAVF